MFGINRRLAALALAGSMAAIVPSCAVMAQTTTQPDPSDPCKSQLGQQSQDEGGGTTKDNAAGGGQSTGDRLSKCGDVLTPPKTGDSDLVKPAPNKGNMPVIEPKSLPKQQNSDPDAK